MWCLVAWTTLALAADPIDDLPEAPAPSDETAGDPEDLPDDALDPERDGAEDAAERYRQRVDAYGLLDPLDEIEAWESYLDEEPDSPFRERVLRRVDELAALGPAGPALIADGELRLAQGVLLDDFDPRTRIMAGFQWGLPDFVDLFADYEHALVRTFSVHGGVRHRRTGWSIETGAHWSPVKSVASGTLVTLLGDLRFNTSPAFGAVRPQVAIGQRVGRVDLAAIGGADVELREGGGATWLVGANATVRVSDAARVFLEGSSQIKHPTWPSGSFHYDTATLGVELLMGGKTGRRDALAATVGASVPFYYRWWVPSQGSAMVRVDAWLDDLKASPVP